MNALLLCSTRSITTSSSSNTTLFPARPLAGAAGHAGSRREEPPRPSVSVQARGIAPCRPAIQPQHWWTKIALSSTQPGVTAPNSPPALPGYRDYPHHCHRSITNNIKSHLEFIKQERCWLSQTSGKEGGREAASDKGRLNHPLSLLEGKPPVLSEEQRLHQGCPACSDPDPTGAF